MMLTDQQMSALNRDGFLMLPSLFNVAEVDRLHSRLSRLLDQPHEANVIEKQSGKVRTAMGLHLRDELFAKLVRHPRLLDPARQILDQPFYIQQVKVNVKAAFSGEAWQWHYDFATHHADDGVALPLALNLHIFLDDVNEFNGPLYFIPGSHRFGAHRSYHDLASTSYPLWVVNDEVVSEMISNARIINPEHGIVSATGTKGTAMIFFDTLVHGSPVNMSPWDRSIFSLIVNPVTNAYGNCDRPDYKHHRNLAPISALADDCLADVSSA